MAAGVKGVAAAVSGYSGGWESIKAGDGDCRVQLASGEAIVAAVPQAWLEASLAYPAQCVPLSVEAHPQAHAIAKRLAELHFRSHCKVCWLVAGLNLYDRYTTAHY